MTEPWFYFSKIGIKMIEQFQKTGNLILSEEEEFEFLHNMNEINKQICKQREERCVERSEERRAKERNVQEIYRHKEQRVETNVRERRTIVRRPLTEVIKSRTRFRLTLKGTTYYCDTENGGSFTGEGEVFKSLNQFCESMIKKSESTNKKSGEGGRKISAYETVELLINKTGEWNKLGLIYNAECTSIN